MSMWKSLLLAGLAAFACVQPAVSQTRYELELRAEAGDNDAMFRLGVRNYLGSYNHPSDFAQSVKWYRAAADKGNAKAMNNLGAMYWNGFGVLRSRAIALNWFKRAADLGDLCAMVSIGSAFENGEGIDQDFGEALKWYRRAADAGSAPGALALAQMYRLGQGVAKDEREATKWFARGNAGLNVADFSVQRLFKLEGLAIERSTGYSDDLEWFSLGSGGLYRDTIATAAPWPVDRQPDQTALVEKLRAAAETGNAAAMNNLALLNLSGVYKLPGSYKEKRAVALTLWRKAVELDSPEAMYNLARTGDGDIQEQLKLYRRAADKGLTEAMYMLGETSGYVPSEHPRRVALDWYLRAAKAGNRNGMFAAAWLYTGGDPGTPSTEDVPRDYVQAMYWFQKAAEKGSVNAIGNIAVMYVHGWGVHTDFSEAYVWARIAAAYRASEYYAKAGDLLASKLQPEHVKDLDGRVREWIAQYKPGIACGTRDTLGCD